MAVLILFNFSLLVVSMFGIRVVGPEAPARTALGGLIAVGVAGNLLLGARAHGAAGPVLWVLIGLLGLIAAGLPLAGLMKFARRSNLSGLERKFAKFESRLILPGALPGLLLLGLDTALTRAPLELAARGPFWALLCLPGMIGAMAVSKPLFLLFQLRADSRNKDLLFEDRFFDLVRGLGALRDVLVDRKIHSGRVLILNPEENLAIERTSAQVDSTPDRMPAGHLAGLLENFAVQERRLSLMNFALLRYEKMELERETGEARANPGPAGLRIRDPLLVLYHYLAAPELAFHLSDALDVIEREELAELMDHGLVARRPGAGLALTGAGLARAGEQIGALSSRGA